MNAMHPRQQTLHWPTSMPELLTAEQFVIWALRTQLRAELSGATGKNDDLYAAFEQLFGPPRSKRAAKAFVTFYGRLRTSARRSLYFHQPRCPGLAADEICLLTILTACQHGDDSLASALAELVAHADRLKAFIGAAASFASSMDDAGLLLPMRDAGRESSGRGPVLSGGATRH